MEKTTIIEMSKVIAQLQNEIDYLSEALSRERAKNAEQKEGRSGEIAFDVNESLPAIKDPF